MRRLAVTCATAVGALLLAAAPALAHNEWEPATAAPGSTPQLRLKVEDERADAGTTKVELIFPAPITVAALPAVPGWTATVTDGKVGASGTGIVWSGGPAPGDLALPVTLGPLPGQPGRMQFKVLQTYDDGSVDRWIDEWAAGAPEPGAPGPVLDLVGPAVAPSTTAGPATTAPATTAPATTQADQAAAEDDSGSSALPIVVAVVVLAAVAGGLALFLRSRRHREV
ncbi:MAG TPA: DUF1775 domain-containing protein [Acidimicrobiales bacterium]|nr:DUF1775 domain-containing protein [Acidimicrobiales bacterium]